MYHSQLLRYLTHCARNGLASYVHTHRSFCSFCIAFTTSLWGWSLQLVTIYKVNKRAGLAMNQCRKLARKRTWNWLRWYAPQTYWMAIRALSTLRMIFPWQNLRSLWKSRLCVSTWTSPWIKTIDYWIYCPDLNFKQPQLTEIRICYIFRARLGFEFCSGNKQSYISNRWPIKTVLS